MGSARAARRVVDSVRPRVPNFSRLTVRKASSAPPGHSVRMGEALRASREALCDIQSQLDGLLTALRSAKEPPAADSADSLRQATRRANMAMARLANL